MRGVTRSRILGRRSQASNLFTFRLLQLGSLGPPGPQGSGRRSRSQKTMEVEQNHQPDEGALAVAEELDGRCDKKGEQWEEEEETCCSQWLKSSMGAVTIRARKPPPRAHGATRSG